MTPQAHKQYLIDGITEMELFISRCINNIYERRDTISKQSLSAMHGVIDRKKENIAQYRELLRKEHAYVSPHILEIELYDFTY